jgi:hypothetical protein
MLQKQPLHALRSFLTELEIVGRVQVEQRKRLDRTLHVKAISLDHFVCHRAGLFSSTGIKFDPVSVSLSPGRDSSKRSARPDAGIKRRATLFGESQERADPNRFCRGQWVKAQTFPSSKTHGSSCSSKVLPPKRPIAS